MYNLYVYNIQLSCIYVYNIQLSCIYVYNIQLSCIYVYNMLNKNTLGVKKVRGQSEAALQIDVRPKTLISVEAKKLLIRNLFNYLNDIQ